MDGEQGMHAGLVMRLAGALLAWALLAVPAWAQVDVDAYLRRDTYQRIKISPDGHYYAVEVPLEDRTVLAVVERATGKVTAKAAGGHGSSVGNFWWVNDTRVVVAVDQRMGSRAEPYPTGELHAMDADGKKTMLLSSPAGVGDDFIGGTIRYTAENAVFLIDPLPDDHDSILVASRPLSSEPYTKVERLNVYTRKRITVATAPVRNASFTTDNQGEVRFARGSGADNVSKLYYRDRRGDDWRLVNDEAQSHRVVWPLAFSRDGRRAFLERQTANGPDEIVSWDPQTGQATALLRDATVDPRKFLSSFDGQRIVGATFMSSAEYMRFFDPDDPDARLYQSLAKALPGLALAATSSTRDGGLVLVQGWSDVNNGDFFLFDTRARKAERIYGRREWFDPAKVPHTRQVTLKARDGLALHGYLTLPAGSAEAPHGPLVVLPHGGPFGVFDRWEFDDDSQMLAAAGYAVLRVNYRGSGNYGRAFQQAGAQEWGKAMQDDLTDATHWAIEQGIADPQRICIYGASYGAYAALMGVAREPALYRCAVGYVGVYDLERMVDDLADKGRADVTWGREWIGEQGTLAQVSPVTLAERIKVPVMLAWGGQDDRAPKEQSEGMLKALQQAGVPVRTLSYPDEGHGFYTDAHRRAFYVALLDFLAQSLGGATASAPARAAPAPPPAPAAQPAAEVLK